MLAYHALKFHTIKSKGSIAVKDQHLLAWPGNLCRHREAGPGTKTAHRAGIEPVARFVDINYTPAIAHNIAAITHHRRILVDKVAYLAAEAHRVNGHGVGTRQCCVTVQCPPFLDANVLQPVALAMLLRCLRQLVHTYSHVAHQGNRCPPVDAHIFSCEIEPDYVRLRWNKRGLTMIEAEIHARANGQDGICSFQGFAA